MGDAGCLREACILMMGHHMSNRLDGAHTQSNMTQLYTSAQRIGAEVAERDAGIWAGLWGLSQNSTKPTVF